MIRDYNDKSTIYYYDFSIRAINALEHYNITTIEQLTLCSEADLFEMRMLGKRTIQEIKEILYSLGKSLRRELNDIKIPYNFIITREVGTDIHTIEFKRITDYLDAIKVLDKHNCNYTKFKAHEGALNVIITNRIGLDTLQTYYE